ncbi:hypothetical protein Angca_004228, partial [Angiostrongylus cantonensis]
VWRADYWLPRGVRWNELPVNFSDLLYPIYFSLPLIVFRIFFESFVGVPLGFALGYYGNVSLIRTIFDHLNGGFARQTRSKRVLECFWRFSYYTFAFAYGCMVLWDKSWLWDVKQCWIGYPFHTIDKSIWLVVYNFLFTNYCFLMTGCYCYMKYNRNSAEIISTLRPLFLSFFCCLSFANISTSTMMVRYLQNVGLRPDHTTVTPFVGSRVTHDTTDALNFELKPKIIFYRWIVTRLGYYPFVIVRSALLDAASLIQPDYELLNLTQVPFAPRVIILMLFTLLILHIFWTVIIMKIVVKTVTQGEAGDVRSDSEASEADES